MNILHIASHSINVGDGAIIYGIQGAIKRFTPRANFWHAEIVDSLNSVWYDAQSIDNAGADLVVVGGGGTIDGSRNREYSGMAFHMPPEELEKLQTPIAFVGLGHNVFPSRSIQYPERLEKFLGVCEKRNIPFLVRNDLSRERLLRDIGSAAEFIEKIPDPGFFVPTPTDYDPPCASIDRDYIILQMCGDSVDARFGGNEEAIKQYQIMSEQVHRLARDNDLSVVAAVHTLDDVGPISVGTGNIDDFGFLRSRFHIWGNFPPDRAPQFFEAYRRAKLVIGMRGHSVICATGLDTPVLALSTHPKVEGYMEEMGISENTLKLGEFDRIYDRGTELLETQHRGVNIQETDEKILSAIEGVLGRYDLI